MSTTEVLLNVESPNNILDEKQICKCEPQCLNSRHHKIPFKKITSMYCILRHLCMQASLPALTDVHINMLLSCDGNGKGLEGTTDKEKVARVTFYSKLKKN